VSVEEAVRRLATKVAELKDEISTEEATKNAFISPFIRVVLGYDIFDPREVIPEYVADVGRKRGEKVDYAIKSGEEFRFLIECKKIGSPLDLDHATQLVHYFNVTDTEFAILTNGEVYEFYTQLDAANRMDEKPFMTLDLGNIDARIFPHLEKCTRQNFDAETITQVAEHLKNVSEVKKELAANLKAPRDEWVRLLAGGVAPKRMTAQKLDYFREVVMTATREFLNDEASKRLRNAQDLDEGRAVPAPLVDSRSPVPAAKVEELDASTRDVDTTDDEIQGLAIVRAIACRHVGIDRVVMRDQKSYCSILFDDNNRKPIARLHFNSKNYRIGLFDTEKNEVLHPIDSVEGIYGFAAEISERVLTLRDAQG